MNTINTLFIPERWQTSEQQIKEMQLVFEFEGIVRQIKTLYLVAIQRLH